MVASSHLMNIWTGLSDCLMFWVYLVNVDTRWTSRLPLHSHFHSLAHSVSGGVLSQLHSPPTAVIYHSDLPSSLPLLLRDSEHVIWSQQATSQPRHPRPTVLHASRFAFQLHGLLLYLSYLDRPSRIRGMSLYNLNILILSSCPTAASCIKIWCHVSRLW